MTPHPDAAGLGPGDDTPATPNPDRLRFDLLLADYQAIREDDRTYGNVMVAALSIAAALLGLLAAGLTQVCRTDAPTQAASCVRPPDLFLAAALLAPAAIAAFIIMSSAVATIRSYYGRAIERELRTFAPSPFPGFLGVGPASYTTLVTEVTSMRRGRITFRILANFSVGTVIVVFGGMGIYIASIVGETARIAMAVVYVPTIFLMSAEFVAATVGGQLLFMRAVARFSVHGARLPVIDSDRTAMLRQRSLASYLLVPRPADWIKAVVAPGVYAFSAYAYGSFDRWASFIALWFILEYLIYEARYQWNDIRGWRQDLGHVERRARARLPIGLTSGQDRSYIVASLAVAMLRIIGTVAVGWALGLLAQTLGLLLLVWGVAAVYEWLRTIPTNEPTRTRATDLAIWLVVGLGYAVRAGLGLAMAGVPLGSTAGIAGLLCFAAFGSMFVLLTWVLEAAGMARIDKQGWHLTADLIAKPHLIPLLRSARIGLLAGEADPAAVRDGRGEKVVRDRKGLAAPWNIALVVACAAAGPFGLALSGVRPDAPAAELLARVPPMPLILGLGAACAILIAAMPGPGTRVLATVAGAVLVGVGALEVGAAKPWVVVAPWATVTVWNLSFRASSYHDLNHVVDYVVVGVVRAGALVLRGLMGRETWRVAGFEDAFVVWAERRLDEAAPSRPPQQRTSVAARGS